MRYLLVLIGTVTLLVLTSPADEDGMFKIEGYVGQSLMMEARSNRPYVSTGPRFEPMERSETVRITLEHPTETVKIIITKLR